MEKVIVTPEEYNMLKIPSHYIHKLKFRTITLIHLHWSTALMLCYDQFSGNEYSEGRELHYKMNITKETRHLPS